MKVLLWLFLFALVVSAAVAAVLWFRARRQRTAREAMWGSLEGEPSHPDWNADALGVSPVRVRSERARLPEDEEEEPLAEPVGWPEPKRQPVRQPAASGVSPRPPEADDVPEPSESTPAEPVASEPPPDRARPMRPRPEWWEDDAPGVGALLRSLVEATGGSAALVRPDPGGAGYLLLAAAGPASAALHAQRPLRRIDEDGAGPLDDLPRDLSTILLGEQEAGLLPGMEPGTVSETAVRALALPPAPRRLLVVDAPADHPLDDRAAGLIGHYADLLARVLGLPTEPPPPEPDPEPADPLASAMKQIQEEMADARESGRALSLAIVVPYEAETLLDGDPEVVEQHEADLRQRLGAVPGTRAIVPMSPLVVAALCEANIVGAERWVHDLVSDGAPVRIGMTVYGPRHISPDLFRQDAISALHQTYTGDDTCVIVE